MQRNKMKIIHIKKTHSLKSLKYEPDADFIDNMDLIDDMVRSQLNVAKAIALHPGCPVLEEGLMKDAHANANEYRGMSDVAKKYFPYGFPEHFDEVTSLQKWFIYEYGGVFTLLYLGVIPSLYRSIDQKISEVLDQQIMKENQADKMFKPRELEAIKRSKEAAIKYYGTFDNAVVLLIYGGGHNFKSYCDEEGFDHEVIETRREYLELIEARALKKNESIYSSSNTLFENDEIKFIIKKYNLPDNTQATLEKALRNLANNNKIDDLKILIKYVKNIDAKDNNPEVGRTALHWAAIKGHHKCYQVLLESGSDCNISDAMSKTAIYYKAENALHIVNQHSNFQKK